LQDAADAVTSAESEVTTARTNLTNLRTEISATESEKTELEEREVNLGAVRIAFLIAGGDTLNVEDSPSIWLFLSKPEILGLLGNPIFSSSKEIDEIIGIKGILEELSAINQDIGQIETLPINTTTSLNSHHTYDFNNLTINDEDHRDQVLDIFKDKRTILKNFFKSYCGDSADTN
jgi:hypothetical protein